MTPEEIAFEAIKRVTESVMKPDIIQGIATEVDKTSCTCTVEREGEAPLLHVRLATVVGESGQAFTIIPKDKTAVQVALFDGSQQRGRIISCQAIDELLVVIKKMSIKCEEIAITCENIVFNGGGNDGLAIVGKVAESNNKIEQDINNLKTAISGWIPVAQDGGAALKTALSSWASSLLQQTSKSNIENPKIKH